MLARQASDRYEPDKRESRIFTGISIIGPPSVAPSNVYRRKLALHLREIQALISGTVRMIGAVQFLAVAAIRFRSRVWN